MAKSGFTRSELALVAGAALLVFSRVFGLSLVLPNFRGHYADAFGAEPVWIGLAFGAYGLTMALMQLPVGILSDKWGRKPMLLAGSAFFVAGSVLAAFAPSIGWLVAARLLQGMGAVSSVAMAAVGETVHPHRRTFAMALVGIPAGGGFLVGMGLGPALYPLISMHGLFLVTAGIGAAAVLPLTGLRFLAAKERPPTPGDKASLGLPVMALALGGFTSNYFLTTTIFFLPETDWKVLLPMLLVALVLVTGSSRRVDASGLTWQPVALGLALIAVAAPTFALAGPRWALWVGGAAFFTFHSLLATTLPSQVSRIAGRSGGRGHGIQNIVAYLGTFTAGPLAGALAGTPAVAFTVAGVLAVAVATLVAVSLTRAGGAPTDA